MKWLIVSNVVELVFDFQNELLFAEIELMQKRVTIFYLIFRTTFSCTYEKLDDQLN